MTFGDYIKKIRQQRGLSAGEVAARLGFSALSSITNIENGKHQIKPALVPKLANVLDVDVDGLNVRLELDSYKNKAKIVPFISYSALVSHEDTINKAINTKREIPEIFVCHTFVHQVNKQRLKDTFAIQPDVEGDFVFEVRNKKLSHFGIEAGDRVVIQLRDISGSVGEDEKESYIGLLWIDNKPILRKVVNFNDTLYAFDNSMNNPIEVDPLTIIGKVTQILRWLGN